MRSACALRTHDPLPLERAAIPQIERLGSLENPDDTALLEHMILTKEGPRPPARWLKTALAIAERQGLGVVQARLQHWLEAFHTPLVSNATIAEAWNCEVVVDAVEYLARQYPEWSASVAPDEIAPLGTALAMEIVSGNVVRFPFERLFLFDRYETRTSYLNAGSLGNRESGGPRYCKHLATSLMASVENEQVLRAAIWMLPHLPDRAGAIDTLEKCAAAGVAMKAGHRDGHRSRPATNAAVAGLGTIGTPEALLALTRLSTRIEERSVLAMIRGMVTA